MIQKNEGGESVRKGIVLVVLGYVRVYWGVEESERVCVCVGGGGGHSIISLKV